METPGSQESFAKGARNMSIAEKKTPLGGSIKSSVSTREGEVFAAGEDGIDFRTVGWIRGVSMLGNLSIQAVLTFFQL
jgi:hypothetical protein